LPGPKITSAMARINNNSIGPNLPNMIPPQ
jgi:hypothetical protein